MPSKKGTTERRRGAAAAEPPAKVSQAASPASRSRKRGSLCDWWPCAVLVFSMLAIFGRFFFADAPPGARPRGEPDLGGGPGKDGQPLAGLQALMRPAGARKGRLLELDLLQQLLELTNLAGEFAAKGALDGEISKTFDKVLRETEETVDKDVEDPAMARDLRAMMTVIRGQVFKEAGNDTAPQRGDAKTYADPEYWDGYYQQTADGELYDWYTKWDSPLTMVGAAQGSLTLGGFLRPLLGEEPRILMLGSGNSDMSERMYRAGFEDITNVDVSEKLMEGMRQRLGEEMPRMRWLRMDATAMSFEAESFDVALDKGMLDALESNPAAVAASVRETLRTLRPGGLFISVTFRNEEVRLKQIRGSAEWGECRSQAFLVPQRKGEIFLHWCSRP